MTPIEANEVPLERHSMREERRYLVGQNGGQTREIWALKADWA